MAKPEIRLKGFKGEWVADQAKQLFSTTNERNRPELPVLSANQDIRGMAPRTESGYTVSHNKANEVTYKVVKPGQYVIHLRSFQGGFAHSAVEGITSPAYTVFGFKDAGRHDDYFWKIIFMSKRFIKSLETITYGIRDGRSIGFGEFSEMKFRFPSRIEQQGIADYFKSLDSMIQGVTKKIASLKQMKQACLVSMFPQAAETTPRVRFKGFKGEWLYVELSECLSVCKERNISETYGKGDVLSVSDDYGVVNQIKLLGRSYAGKSVANYRILRKGHIVYTKSPLKVKPYGIIKVNSGKDGIVSTLYAVYTPMDWVSAEFINYYFEPSFRMNKYIHPLVNKGAKNDMKVSDENVLKGKIYIPKEKKEQEEIASFFRSLDSQISLQEQRLEKLKQIKSACLDKMFV